MNGQAAVLAAHELYTVTSYEQAHRAAAEFLQSHRERGPLVVLGASRGVAEDVVRRHAGASYIGLHTMTLAQMAAQCAATALARFELAPVTPLGLQAVTARVVFKLRREDKLGYFTPVADTPGFVRGAARTISELRVQEVSPEMLSPCGAPGAALATILRAFNEQVHEANLADQATLFGMAGQGGDHLMGLPVLAIDVALRSTRAAQFARKVAERSRGMRVLVLAADTETIAAWERCLDVKAREWTADAGNDTLGHVRRYLFGSEVPKPPARDDSLELFSAPSEWMECLDVARRVQTLAAQGVPFDRMAVLLRDPHAYQSLIEEAMRRAGVPAYFHHGTARPNEGGRAFLALLRCAGEQCSAARFAEYLSLAQVPELDSQGRPVRKRLDGVPVGDEVAASLLREDTAAEEAEPGPSLTAPWRWEELLVDAAVIGGAERWERRLQGLANELKARREKAADDGERERFERDLGQLSVLGAYSVPLIRMLAALPAEATWGEWLVALRELAETALKDPVPVVAVVDELQPMADVGPAGLDEVYAVIEDRLRFLRREPPKRRYGQVFVAPVEEARGRWFDVVFVPGLAEGMFPRRQSEDPLLLDTLRKTLDAGLTTQDVRVARERLLLRGAVAAGARVVVSYPRVDSAQSRPRVPSFYALELLRGAEGELPDLREFQARAAKGSPLRLGWPAPRDPSVAVDNAEYDLAVLDRAWAQPHGRAKGMGRYLMDANPHLRDSLRARWRRWNKGWKAEDGLVAAGAPALEVLKKHGLKERVYSATALERFAVCPYRFYLQAIYGLSPREDSVALEQMDPKTRGTIFHDLLHELILELRRRDLLPLLRTKQDQAIAVADEVVAARGAYWEAELAPAIPRVWASEMEDLRFDLRGWVNYIAGDPWVPVESEFGFGDPPVELLESVKLRGRIDVIERNKEGIHRVTDLKTGRKPLEKPIWIGGGKTLQPSLYAMVVEQLLQAKVEGGRLFYCTHRGGYDEAPIMMRDFTRQKTRDVLQIIDNYVATGFLPPAPEEKACERCDYRPVCGPYEEERLGVKDERQLESLIELRRMQ